MGKINKKVSLLCDKFSYQKIKKFDFILLVIKKKHFKLLSISPN